MELDTITATVDTSFVQIKSEEKLFSEFPDKNRMFIGKVSVVYNMPFHFMGMIQ